MTNARREEVEEDEAGQTRPLRLDELPLEILLHIFDYCHAFDLVRLSGVCTRFYAVAHDDVLWCKRSKHTLVTNQVSKRFCSRCNPVLDPRKKWQITHNWEYGRYQKNVLFSQKIKLMPWIQLTDKELWWSGGNQMFGFRRSDPFNLGNKIFHENTRSDICKFVVRDDYIISGHRDGSIKYWMKNVLYGGNHFYGSIERAHSRDVDAVDETGDLVISGSADGVVKAWTSPKNQDIISNLPLTSVRVNDRIWALAADPTGTKLAVGSSGTTGPPLYICNIMDFNRSETMNHPWRQGAGILDMVWDSPHILLTCGYDTCIRKWDLRVNKCVGVWSDPTDATIYCISSDYNYTMVTGTQFNCKAVLWDQRRPQYVQLYFMNLRRMSSPIYSVSFDSSHLYGATDQNVIEVKFSGEPNVKKNYREIMKYDAV
ncbi:hypothetical protein TSAR_015181 [Trichomalopsis sarcophagae]|uniref:F-box domain-containing protein n=1 Tax=Trichomalopsis sarcophagae TaxID=543379 RepID=A0A232FE56_9HYME|nr:hypothetical protein TSAR_015181 [Trichomalopsis sarcophagae]